MSNKLSQARETGQEKSTSTCVICGAQVPAITSAYGSVAPGACTKCWPAQAPTQLAAQVAAASVVEPPAE